MSEENFLTVEETLEKLGVTEEQLLNMVAANQLRAFMKDREMHFKPEDVEAVSASGGATEVVDDSSGDDEVLSLDDDFSEGIEPVEEEEVVLVEEEPAVSLEDSEAQTVVADVGADELDLDLDLNPTAESGTGTNLEAITDSNFEFEDAGESGEATVVISADEVADEVGTADTDIGLGTEEIIFEDDDLAIGVEEAAGGGASDMMTVQEDAVGFELDDDDGLTVIEDAVEATQELGDDELSVTDDEPAPVSRRSSVRRGRRSSEAEEDYDTPSASIVWTLVMAACFIIALLPLTVLMTEISHGVTLKGGIFSAGEFDVHGDLPRMGALFVPPHLAAIVSSDKDGYIDASADGPHKWFGEPVSINEKISLAEWRRKYGVGQRAVRKAPKPKKKETKASVEKKEEKKKSRRGRGEDKASKEEPKKEEKKTESKEEAKPKAKEVKKPVEAKKEKPKPIVDSGDEDW